MQLFLTDDLIRGLSVPAGRQRITVTDAACSGLSLEIRTSGEGSWRYRYSASGTQQCLSLGLLSEIDVAQARSSYFELRQQIEAGIDPKAGGAFYGIKQCPTFEDFIHRLYLPHIRTYKRCVTADETLLNNHLIPQFGALKLNEITPFAIHEFVSQKLCAGYKPSYCNRFLVLLGFCFNLAMKWEISGVNKNPVKAIPLLKFNNKIERFLKEDECERLLLAIENSVNPLLRYFVPLALMTGARKRELLDAKWEDFDFERKVWVIPMTKSGRPRHVPLIPEVVFLLHRLREALPKLMSQQLLLEIPWVLPNPKTGKPFKTIFNSWNTARHEAGVEDLRIHDLRHSFASALVNNGVPIYDVQKLLGHQDVRTTERYSHLAPERLRASAANVVKSYKAFPKFSGGNQVVDKLIEE
jgi:integrase